MAGSTSRFARRALQAVKRKAIVRLGFISDQKFYLDSGISRQRTDVERIQLYCDAIDVEFILPVDGSKTRNTYRPRYVYGLDGATVDPLSGLIYDAQGQFIAESSSWLALRQFYDWPQPYIKIPGKALSGEYIFLPSNSYYHWLIEDLPTFLKSLAVAPQATVLMPARSASYVREVVKMTGRAVMQLDAPVRVERLVMTGKTAGQGSPLAGLTPHPSDVAVLRSFFSSQIADQPPDRRLYLSRLGQKRSPSNETALQRMMEQAGFEPFDGSKMTLIEQIALFTSATHLVGIHGASLANIAWCPERVSVCEIFSSDYLPGCYAALTAIRNGHYTSVLYDPGEGNAIDKATIERLSAIACTMSAH